VFAVRCTAGSEAEGKTTEVAPEPVEAEPAEGEQGLLLLLYYCRHRLHYDDFLVSNWPAYCQNRFTSVTCA